MCKRGSSRKGGIKFNWEGVNLLSLCLKAEPRIGALQLPVRPSVRTPTLSGDETFKEIRTNLLSLFAGFHSFLNVAVEQ